MYSTEAILPKSPITDKGIETGVFENGCIVVNHRSLTYRIPDDYRVVTGTADGLGIPDNIIAAHGAAWIQKR